MQWQIQESERWRVPGLPQGTPLSPPLLEEPEGQPPRLTQRRAGAARPRSPRRIAGYGLSEHVRLFFPPVSLHSVHRLARRGQCLGYSSRRLAVLASGSQGAPPWQAAAAAASAGEGKEVLPVGALGPGRIRAGSSNRRENETASLRGQPARSWGFREPQKLLGRKGTHSSQLVSQRDSYALAPTPAGNRDVGGVSPNPALHLAGLWRPFRRHFHVHQACHPPNSLRDVDGATAATSTALWERNA